MSKVTLGTTWWASLGHRDRRLHTCNGIFIDCEGGGLPLSRVLFATVTQVSIRYMKVNEAYASVKISLPKVSGR